VARFKPARAALALAVVLAGLTACGSEQAVTAGLVTPPSPSVSTAPGPSASPRPSPSPRPEGGPRPTPVPTPPGPHPAVAPGWTGPVYPPRLHGYDVSYPQCPGHAAPAGATFSIIGANRGKAFTVNPCLRTQWLTARGVRTVYFNSGYDPDNAGAVTSDCASRSGYQEGGRERQTAYAIGCSEAVFAVNTLAGAGASRTAMIWLDVEQSNSWDLVNLDLNRTALQAEIDELAAFGHMVGMYSTSYQWHSILGDWSPAGVVADWVAGQTPQAVCGTTGFSGHPVWIAQELDTWSGVDSDWTC
jgi:hypothetical protein